MRVTALAVGEWDGSRLAATDPENVGLLVLDGVMAREVVVGDTVSTELLGPGDIVRPWQLTADAELLRVERALERALASCGWPCSTGGRRPRSASYPEVTAVADRPAERARAAPRRRPGDLAAHRVDRAAGRAVLAPRRALGARHRRGRRRPARAVAPRARPARRRAPPDRLHRARPARRARTASQRRHDGTWLLLGAPVGVDVEPAEVVRQRRRLMPSSSSAGARAGPERRRSRRRRCRGTQSASRCGSCARAPTTAAACSESCATGRAAARAHRRRARAAAARARRATG